MACTELALEDTLTTQHVNSEVLAGHGVNLRHSMMKGPSQQNERSDHQKEEERRKRPVRAPPRTTKDK